MFWLDFAVPQLNGQSLGRLDRLERSLGEPVQIHTLALLALTFGVIMTGKYMQSIRVTYGGCKKGRRGLERGDRGAPGFTWLSPPGDKAQTRIPQSCHELLPGCYQVP